MPSNMKDPLHDFVIATIGDAGSGISAAKLKRFIEANGGRYVSSVSEDTTHLLCSQEHWTAQIGEGAQLMIARSDLFFAANGSSIICKSIESHKSSLIRLVGRLPAKQSTKKRRPLSF